MGMLFILAMDLWESVCYKLQNPFQNRYLIRQKTDRGLRLDIVPKFFVLNVGSGLFIPLIPNDMMRILSLLLLIPALSNGQNLKQDSIWRPFQPFIGTWTGTGKGHDGAGIYERSYQFILNRKYIEVRNKTTYAASKEKPKGYVHEDVGYISYDKARKTFVFRQFHMEGFVNQYVLDSLSSDKKTMVFVSEAIENIPKGWRAREMYIMGENTLNEVFSLAELGKDFETYTMATLTRKK